ncbi:MAG: 1-(5-phosphoribosyl)-5-[Candidatus Methanomethylophilaceae archaeon]|nr:1-(5-phosphoribosyl)-5-[(5-phosphoribosylamino)methylideneamino] imidazole-4-carboxamide isomerase [Candidatus Methanomethylophilaceae archaeon]MBR2348752.1 1-(5-phosphoribosyl)-5-[(5-phosphoribosylamino)methylideneamino] imidazole-4-carboxamide isomerase [Candidatus Methanomethylophilaceae archaeon]
MRVIPAVDVLDHQVVQLVGGVPGSQQIVMPDPMEVAGMWVARGAPYLHLVDLDGAFGKENNVPIFKQIIREYGVPAEVGGGIRDVDTIDELISAGADRVVVGTKAVKEPEWLEEVADRHPGRIVLSMDTKGGEIAIKGWQESAAISVDDMFARIRDMPLAAVLNTNVDVEGQKKGIDEAQARDFISKCPCKVIASGGVTSRKDAEILSDAGAEGAVVGLAMYTNVITPWEWDTPWHA